MQRSIRHIGSPENIRCCWYSQSEVRGDLVKKHSVVDQRMCSERPFLQSLQVDAAPNHVRKIRINDVGQDTDGRYNFSTRALVSRWTVEGEDQFRVVAAFNDESSETWRAIVRTVSPRRTLMIEYIDGDVTSVRFRFRHNGGRPLEHTWKFTPGYVKQVKRFINDLEGRTDTYMLGSCTKDGYSYSSQVNARGVVESVQTPEIGWDERVTMCFPWQVDKNTFDDVFRKPLPHIGYEMLTVIPVYMHAESQDSSY